MYPLRRYAFCGQTPFVPAMTDAEYTAQKKRVKSIWDKWSNMLGLRTWQRVSIEYFRDDVLPRHDGESDRTPTAAVADVRTHWQYRTAHVRICLPAAMNEDDYNLEYIIVHEMCHMLVNEMREEEDRHNHEEHVVTGLAMAFGWVERITEQETRKLRKAVKNHELPQ